ncbi:MAG TPA: PIG-L family deacetylase [Vicinamibacterales bacterium]
MTSRVLLFLAIAAAAAATPGGLAGAQEPTPQYRIQPLSDLTGAPALSLALRKLQTIGTLIQATAHPDDEPNGMLALHARHLGMRVALVTATRGDGGQNEIGPELFDALGILRTEELLAAHRFDGAEQYFTRAVDFGYSFGQEETLEKWGRQEILGDYVRHIRAIRPDVIVTMSPEGMGGGQHHQTSAILAAEAFRAAADPAQFPEQIREGLRPWQAKKLYRPAGGFGGRGGGRGGRGGGAPPPPEEGIATLDTNLYEPLLGCTIGEVGSVASGMHMCQGRVPMVPQPGPSFARYRLVETKLPKPERPETSLFQGIDVTLAGLARFAGDRPPPPLTASLTSIASHVDGAVKALESRGTAAAIGPLVSALTAVRGLASQLGSMGLPDDARYEIESRLRVKEDQLQDAIVIASALRLDATANDGLVVPGQPLGVSVVVGNRGSGELAVSAITLAGFDGPGSCARGVATNAAPYQCSAAVKIPSTARLTDVYWQRPEDAGRAAFAPDAPFGLPFRPTPFRARVELDVAGARIVRDLPVQFRYEGPGLVGEKRMELQVVPPFASSVSPHIAVVPMKAPANSAAGREVRVTVINGTKGSAAATVRLKAPAGWRIVPATAPLTFAREDEAVTTRFTVAPPIPAKAGDVELTAEVVPALGSDPSSAVGYQVIEYPHIQRRHKLIPAVAKVKVIDVAIAPALSIGYIMGVGDQVPPALIQLGARLTMIDPDEMAWGDLSKYNTIVTGVRAYERRADLRANNHRLLKYVENGGTAIVQYNKMEFNQAQYGPYRALVSSDRITDENAPVKVLVPTHALFTYPNRIDERAWKGWVQERGLYFLGERDSKYVDLVEMEDPFEFNKGVKRGALVEAKYGKGRWLYVGLGLWRQLPSGTDGAYRLFANLISLGKAPRPAAAIAVER